MIRRLFLLFLLATTLPTTLPTTLHAQTTAPALPNHLEILVIPPTGDPTTVPPITNGTRSTPISAASPFCNLASSVVPGLPLSNPTLAEVDDPFLAPGSGRVCRVPMPVNLAVGTAYRGVAVYVADACTVAGVPTTNCRSPRSAVGVPPFNVTPILGPPVVPTNLGIRQ